MLQAPTPTSGDVGLGQPENFQSPTRRSSVAGLEAPAGARARERPTPRIRPSVLAEFEIFPSPTSVKTSRRIRSMVAAHRGRSRDGDGPVGAKLLENRARQARENRLENSGYLPGRPPGAPAFWLQRGKFVFSTVFINTPNTLQTSLGVGTESHRVIFPKTPTGSREAPRCRAQVLSVGTE